MRWGEDTGRRPSGSTRDRCLTSLAPTPMLAVRMAPIREVVEALGRRAGVDAVVLVGRDGLPIDSHAKNGVDPENVAALLPSLINGMTQLGEAARRGEFGAGVLEFGKGLAVVSVLNADAVLVVLVQPSTNVRSEERRVGKGARR